MLSESDVCQDVIYNIQTMGQSGHDPTEKLENMGLMKA